MRPIVLPARMSSFAASSAGIHRGCSITQRYMSTTYKQPSGPVRAWTGRNHEFVDPWVDWGDLPRTEQLVLADAQTSGGLLIATTRPDVLEAALGARGLPVQRIGETTAGPSGRIRVTGRLSQE